MIPRDGILATIRLLYSRQTVRLELAFSTKRLRDICVSEATAKRELGTEVALALQHRLADIRAATCIRDVVAGHPRPAVGRGNDTYLIDLPAGVHLLLRSNHAQPPVTAGNRIDWDKVSRIKIIEIGPTHA